MAPTRAMQRAAFRPSLLRRVEDFTTLQHPVDDPMYVVPASHHELAAGQRRRRTAPAGREHVRALHPPPNPSVEHFDDIENIMLIVPATQRVQLVWQRCSELEKGRHVLAQQGQWQ